MNYFPLKFVKILTYIYREYPKVLLCIIIQISLFYSDIVFEYINTNLMKYLLLTAVTILVLGINPSFSQDDDDDLIFGKTTKLNSAALYDLSDPTGVNIEVNLWGFVRYPGKYRVPLNTTFMDVMSYAGGPVENTNLEDIRILRNSDNVNGKPEVIKLNYNDFLWDEKISTAVKLNPVLKPGDVILVLEEKRYSLRDNIGFILPIVTTVVAITTLIITLRNN